MTNEEMAFATPKAQQVATHFEGERLNQMFKLADQFYKAGCFGADVKNPQQALVKMQAGFEMGMPPVEAMNSLYIVNGHITIFGTAMAKRLRLHGWEIKYDDKTDECTVTIKKGNEEYSYTATATELRKLNSKAFAFAPKEKLRWHALSRIIRFHVPEVLEAGIGYLKEEAEDMRGVQVIDANHVLDQKPATDIPAIVEQIKKAKSEEEIKAVAVNFQGIDLTAEQAQELGQAIVEQRKKFPTPAEEAPKKTRKTVKKEEPKPLVESAEDIQPIEAEANTPEQLTNEIYG